MRKPGDQGQRPLCGILMALLVTLAGCSQESPVEEVTAEASSVGFREDDLTHLQDDWAQWRGTAQSGIASGADLRTTWSESSHLKWRVPVPGRGHSSPVVVDDRIFLATAHEEKQQQLIIAFDFQTGEEIWRSVINEGGFPGPGQMHRKSTHANGTVACDGEHVYIAFLHHETITAYALAASTGEVVWKRKMGPFRSQFGYAPSPTLYHSFVIFACDHKGGGFLAAVDRKTGKIAWRVKRPVVSTYSSPRVVTLKGRDQLLMTGNRQVISYDPRTGETNWKAAGTAEATCGTIVAGQGLIFASGGHPQQETIALDSKGQRQWSARVKLYEPSLILVNNLLVGVTDAGIAHCWDPRTGQEHWKERLGGNFSASPVSDGKHIVVSNLSGETFVFAATAENDRKIAINRIGSDCYASPAIYRSHLVLRIGAGRGSDREEELVCIKPPRTKPVN